MKMPEGTGKFLRAAYDNEGIAVIVALVVTFVPMPIFIAMSGSSFESYLGTLLLIAIISIVGVFMLRWNDLFRQSKGYKSNEAGYEFDQKTGEIDWGGTFVNFLLVWSILMVVMWVIELIRIMTLR